MMVRPPKRFMKDHAHPASHVLISTQRMQDSTAVHAAAGVGCTGTLC